jgi:hypothetical protein
MLRGITFVTGAERLRCAGPDIDVVSAAPGATRRIIG